MGVKFEGDLFVGVTDFLDTEERFSGITVPHVPMFEVFPSFEKIDFKTVSLALSFSLKFPRPGILGRLTTSAVISPLLFLVFLFSSFFLNSILAKVTPLVGHDEVFDDATTELLFTNIPAFERLPRCGSLRLFI